MTTDYSAHYWECIAQAEAASLDECHRILRWGKYRKQQYDNSNNDQAW